MTNVSVDPRAQGENTNNKSGPISLPELTPLQQNTRRPLPSPSFPSTDTFAPKIPSSRPRHFPKVTSWGEDDATASRGEEAANHREASPPAVEESFGPTGVNLGRGGGSSPNGPPPEETAQGKNV
jgi:hypothetical protein